jgi:hypothetical protein
MGVTAKAGEGAEQFAAKAGGGAEQLAAKAEGGVEQLAAEAGGGAKQLAAKAGQEERQVKNFLWVVLRRIPTPFYFLAAIIIMSILFSKRTQTSVNWAIAAGFFLGLAGFGFGFRR